MKQGNRTYLKKKIGAKKISRRQNARNILTFLFDVFTMTVGNIHVRLTEYYYSNTNLYLLYRMPQYDLMLVSPYIRIFLY